MKKDLKDRIKGLQNSRELLQESQNLILNSSHTGHRASQVTTCLQYLEALKLSVTQEINNLRKDTPEVVEAVEGEAAPQE